MEMNKYVTTHDFQVEHLWRNSLCCLKGIQSNVIFSLQLFVSVENTVTFKITCNCYKCLH